MRVCGEGGKVCEKGVRCEGVRVYGEGVTWESGEVMAYDDDVTVCWEGVRVCGGGVMWETDTPLAR